MVNHITNKFVGLKCLTETNIRILYDHVDHTHFHIVEMGCQMVHLLSTNIVRPTMIVNLTPALSWKLINGQLQNNVSRLVFNGFQQSYIWACIAHFAKQRKLNNEILLFYCQSNSNAIFGTTCNPPDTKNDHSF